MEISYIINELGSHHVKYRIQISQRSGPRTNLELYSVPKIYTCKLTFVEPQVLLGNFNIYFGLKK